MEKALLNLLASSLDLRQAEADAAFYQREAEDMRAFREQIGKDAGHREWSCHTGESGRP